MKYRTLGKTNLTISEIGFGTAQIGGMSHIGGRHVGYPIIETSKALKILNNAYDIGINFYDTSDKYGDGKAERLLAKVFSGKRDRVVYATKCGITATGNRCFEKKYVKSRLEQSLRNLKTTYIDVYLLTKPDMTLIESEEIYELLNDLKSEGKIRFSGISTGTDEETLKLVSDNQVDTLQIFYNLLHIKPNQLFIKNAFDSGIGLMVRSPLSSGLLTGKYNYDTTFAKGDNRSYFLHGQILKSRVDIVAKIKKHFQLNSEYSILHFSLNYLLSNSKISTIVVGINKISQFYDILKVFKTQRMKADEVLEVEKFMVNIADE